MTRFAVAAGLAVLLLAGCREDDAEVLPPVGERRVALEEGACTADGGRWGEGAQAGVFVCYRRTPDGGEPCAAAGDCTGYCLARSRTCAPVTPLLGCNDVLGGTGRENTICVE